MSEPTYDLIELVGGPMDGDQLFVSHGIPLIRFPKLEGYRMTGTDADRERTPLVGCWE